VPISPKGLQERTLPDACLTEEKDARGRGLQVEKRPISPSSRVPDHDCVHAVSIARPALPGKGGRLGWRDQTPFPSAVLLAGFRVYGMCGEGVEARVPNTRATAAVRVRTSSFAKVFSRWRRTVSGER
jgi:hypothetical protein